LNRYQLCGADLPFAAEFLANPIGYHSPGLQRVLNVLRGGPLRGKYVLVILEPYRRWQLARLPGVRGAPVQLVEGVIYTDRLQAERDVFRRRWQEMNGPDLSDLPAPGVGSC
jgi:hypothetical protein